MNSSSTPACPSGRSATNRFIEAKADRPERAATEAWQFGQSMIEGQVAVVVLAQFPWTQTHWAYSRFAANPLRQRSVKGLVFFRQLGCGYEGGFGLRPSFTRQGLFLVFSDPRAAGEFIQASDWIESYRLRSSELLYIELHAFAAKGSWAGFRLQPTRPPPASNQPLVTLTRASIRPSKAFKFWRDAAPAHRQIETARGCELACGIGEAPLLRQATISLWKDQTALTQYARSGAHQRAIEQSDSGHYFSEALFARFELGSIRGVFKGKRYG